MRMLSVDQIQDACVYKFLYTASILLHWYVSLYDILYAQIYTHICMYSSATNKYFRYSIFTESEFRDLPIS